MANVEFGTGKTVLILTIVAACFAVLWPKIFYPMLVAPPGGNPPTDNVNGCCDVIFETDVNAIKIMYEMCGSIFKRHQELDSKLSTAFRDGKFSKNLVDVCRAEVFNICGIDIAEILNEKVRLGHSYRQILDEIRSYNISACLRQNFGVSPGSLGTPRLMRLWGPDTSRHLRQERPLHLRPEIMHPALRERGRAIPQSNVAASQPSPDKEGGVRPQPIPGMRPPMGGPGHVVPPPKVGATMSIVMPLYTIGIVIFSMYTIMKVFVRKTGNNENYKDFNSDPEFRRVVFAEDHSNGCEGAIKNEGLRSRSKCDAPLPLWKTPSEEGTRLGDVEIDYLRKKLEETERAMERIVAQIGTIPGKIETSTRNDTGTNDLNKLKRYPVVFTETGEEQAGDVLEQFREQSRKYTLKPHIPGDKRIVMTAITGLLAEVDQQLSREGDTQNQYSTDLKGEEKDAEEICTEDVSSSRIKDLSKAEQVYKREKNEDGMGDILHEPVGAQYAADDSKPKVKVMGVETVAECEGGQKWSRPVTPTLGVGGQSRGTSSPPVRDLEPQNIFLEGSLPTQSQLLVTDSKTQTLSLPSDEGPEPPIILSGKVTLSLISLDAKLPEEGASLPYSAAINEDSNQGDAGDVDANENMDDDATNYTTATMSEGAEAVVMPEGEDTVADLSNTDALEVAEDEEVLPEEDHIWNGTESEINRISAHTSDDENLDKND